MCAHIDNFMGCLRDREEEGVKADVVSDRNLSNQPVSCTADECCGTKATIGLISTLFPTFLNDFRTSSMTV
jgi:hypothetical protein